MNRKAITAGVFLAFQFMLHIFRRIRTLFVKPTEGHGQFMENFSQEGIWAFRHSERDHYPEFSTCINCGICLFGTRTHGADPRLYALSFYRDLRIPSPLVGEGQGEGWALMNPSQGDKAVEMCPTRVPLGKILTFMGEKR